MGRDYASMTMPELEELRSLVLDRIAAVPAFRRGSLQVGYRKCGKPGCRCARPGEPGHGPRGLWTRTAKGSGSRGQYIPVDQIDQVRAELDRYAQFAVLVEDYVEINEALCTAQVRPASTRRRKPADQIGDPAASGGEKGGPATSPMTSRR